MLPAAHRLRRSRDFADTVRGGRRAGRGSIVVHFIPPASAEVTSGLPGDQPAKAGFVVSKAVGGAITRNRVKRRLRHIVAARMAELPPGCSIVVRALPSAAVAGYPAMAKDFDDALVAAQRPRERR
jgi:ribonuclease P protein component